MNDFPTNVKEKLNSIIMDMAKHHWLFSNNPGHDFMRQDLGKLSFYDTMRMIINLTENKWVGQICMMQIGYYIIISNTSIIPSLISLGRRLLMISVLEQFT